MIACLLAEALVVGEALLTLIAVQAAVGRTDLTVVAFAWRAADVATWQYAEPYAQYSLTGTEPDFFTDPVNGYTALVDDDGTLIGYRCFGPTVRCPGTTTTTPRWTPAAVCGLR